MTEKIPMPDQLRTLRQKRGLNQKDFWRRFGAIQNAGSRYKIGRVSPSAQVAPLIALGQSGALTDVDLE